MRQACGSSQPYDANGIQAPKFTVPTLVGLDGGKKEGPEVLLLEFIMLSFIDPQVPWTVFDKFCITEDSVRPSPIWSLCLLGDNDNVRCIFGMGSHRVLVLPGYFHSSSEEDVAI